MDMNLWLKKAKVAIAELPDSKIFVVRNLFQECEWDALPKGDRIAFGKFFKGEVLEGRIAQTVFLDRAKNNHSKYKKQKEEER